jgi:hypothetical protein
MIWLNIMFPVLVEDIIETEYSTEVLSDVMICASISQTSLMICLDRSRSLEVARYYKFTPITELSFQSTKTKT